MSFALRVLAVIAFVVAALGVASPVLLTPLGLALWCASTLPPRSGAHPG
jgi:hypothetical protein